MVIEAQSPIAELLAKHPVLLTKVVNDLQLALIHPPGNGDQQKAEWVEHSLGFQSPLSRVRSYGGTIADSYRSSFRTILAPASRTAVRLTVVALWYALSPPARSSRIWAGSTLLLPTV